MLNVSTVKRQNPSEIRNGHGRPFFFTNTRLTLANRRYDPTDRIGRLIASTPGGIGKVSNLYPPKLLDLNELRNLKVLDAPSGPKALIAHQMVAEGVDCFSLDLALDNPIAPARYTFKGNCFDTGFPRNSYDVIYTTNGPMSYDTNENRLIFLRELERILKVGGVLRIAPNKCRFFNGTYFRY